MNTIIKSILCSLIAISFVGCSSSDGVKVKEEDTVVEKETTETTPIENQEIEKETTPEEVMKSNEEIELEEAFRKLDNINMASPINYRGSTFDELVNSLKSLGYISIKGTNKFIYQSYGISLLIEFEVGNGYRHIAFADYSQPYAGERDLLKKAIPTFYANQLNEEFDCTNFGISQELINNVAYNYGGSIQTGNYSFSFQENVNEASIKEYAYILSRNEGGQYYIETQMINDVEVLSAVFITLF